MSSGIRARTVAAGTNDRPPSRSRRNFNRDSRLLGFEQAPTEPGRDVRLDRGGISIASDTSGIWVTSSQERFVSWVMDVLVYIVVLNLFVQYVPSFITESFAISIFTAVILKLLIDAITGLERRVSGWFNQHEGWVWRAVGLVATLSILFFSKFVILEVVDLVFRDRVTLGGFLDVALLVVTMILARLGISWAYHRLGQVRPPS